MSLKLKIRSMFPALVSAASPITLIKNGLSYVFGLDISALRSTLDSIYVSLPIGASSVTGTTTNDNAAAGYIGEYKTASLAYASRVTMVSATSQNVISISLGPGDWSVMGQVKFEGTSSAVASVCVGGLSTTTNTLDQTTEDKYVYGPAISATILDVSAVVPSVRFSLAVTTTIFLVANTTFTPGTIKAWGIITARRVR